MLLVQSPKDYLKGVEDLNVGERAETIQTTSLVRSARIMRRVLETWIGTCCHLDYSQGPPATADMNNSPNNTNDNNIIFTGNSKREREKEREKYGCGGRVGSERERGREGVLEYRLIVL